MHPNNESKRIALIPNGWKLTTLGATGHWLSGGTPAKSRPSYWGGSMPWVSPKDMKRFRLQDTLDHITDQAVMDGARTVTRGSVFIVVRGMILAHSFPVCIAEREMSFNQDVKAIVANESVHGGFLAHWLNGHSNQILSLVTEATHGTKRIELSALRAVPLVLPPLVEQRRIAEVLDALDAAIRQSEQLIAKLKQMKQGLLYDLLTRGIDDNGELRDPERHPEQFHGSPLGLIPRAWKVLPLERCVKQDAPITYGIVQAGPHIPNGIPYIRTGDMAGDALKIDGLLRTSPRIAANYSRSRVEFGDIVCAIRATVGKVLPVPMVLDGANLTQGTARIAPRRELNGLFLLWALRTEPVQRQFELCIKGTTFKEITLAALRKIPMHVPDNRAEQDRIAEMLQDIENLEQQEVAGASKLQLMKQGLMEDLLTGRVRVTDLETTP
jgi:type I restriction enzyme S subunit